MENRFGSLCACPLACQPVHTATDIMPAHVPSGLYTNIVSVRCIGCSSFAGLRHTWMMKVPGGAMSIAGLTYRVLNDVRRSRRA